MAIVSLVTIGLNESEESGSLVYEGNGPYAISYKKYRDSLTVTLLPNNRPEEQETIEFIRWGGEDQSLRGTISGEKKQNEFVDYAHGQLKARLTALAEGGHITRQQESGYSSMLYKAVIDGCVWYGMARPPVMLGQAGENSSEEELAPRIIWAKVAELGKKLKEVSERLAKHEDVADLQESITAFTANITIKHSGPAQAVQLYTDGQRLLDSLSRHEKIQEHRHAASYRGQGENSFHQMPGGKKALIVLAGGIVFGLLALLVLYVMATAKTKSQQLVNAMIQSMAARQPSEKTAPKPPGIFSKSTGHNSPYLERLSCGYSS